MRKRPLCIIFIGLMIGICLMQALGISWIWRSPEGPIQETQDFMNAKIEAFGIVYQQEEQTCQNEISSYIYLKQTILKINSKEYPVRNIKCMIEGTQEPLLEAKITVTGYLSIPETPTNPGEFNVKLWEQSQKIDYYIEECKIQKIHEKNNGIFTLLADMRNLLLARLHEIFPDDEAGILDAMLFGTKDLLSDDIKNNFQAAGISHIMAISGLHISLVGMAVWSGLQWLGIPMGISVGVSFSVLMAYMVLIGNPTTALRAFFMFVLMALAKLLGRAYDKLSALSLAGILLLLDNPDLLFYCGFQLSFLAVVGMSVFGETIEKIYQVMWKEKNKKIWKEIRMGSSLWFFSLPVVLFHFYQVSVIGIICNLLVIPLLPVLVGSAFCSLFMGYFGLGIGSVVGIPAYIILKLYQWLGEISTYSYGGVWTPGQPSIIVLAIYYILIAVIWLCLQYLLGKEEIAKKYKWRITLGHLVAMIVLLFFIGLPWKNPDQIAVLDVGQGDGIVLQNDGYAALIDGGSSSRNKVGKNVIIPYLKQQGISTLHMVIVTHSDQDHVNGIIEVLEEAQKGWLRLENLCMPGWMENTDVGLQLSLLAQQAGVRVEYLHKGDKVLMGETIFWILHPGYEDYSEEPNDGSIVFLLKTPKSTGLFMGDLPSEQEEMLLDNVIECDYIKIGHHGSNSSTTEGLLERVGSAVALISCGENNRYGHPGEELLERLEGMRVFRTDQQGALIIHEKDLAQIK